MQTDNNFVNFCQYDFSQHFSLLDLALFSKDVEKSDFPNKENLPIKDFSSQIDYPPEVC